MIFLHIVNPNAISTRIASIQNFIPAKQGQSLKVIGYSLESHECWACRGGNLDKSLVAARLHHVAAVEKPITKNGEF